MSCNTFVDCITADPLVGTDAPERYQHIGNLLITAINLVAAILWSLLLIYVVFNLAQAIYRMALSSKDEDAFKIIQETFSKVIWGVVGMLLVYGGRFILATVLGLIGISSGDNIFINARNILLP